REGNAVTITWAADERRKCDHGCGQWEHDHRDIVILATASIDDSRDRARCSEAVLRAARTAPGRYEIKIAEALPPNAFATVELESGSVASITTTVVGDVVHVLTCGGDGRPVDTDFRIVVASPSGCPKDADDHEWSDCAFCHPGREPETCQECGKTTYALE